MTASPPAAPGRIFISYRREETAYPAGWLFDRLAEHFGGGQVFKDVDGDVGWEGARPEHGGGPGGA
jgi:hypothetical protein